MRNLIKVLAGWASLGLALPVAAQNAGSWGIGYGIPYGNLGVNIDYRVVSEFYLSGAVGSGFNDIGYAFGARYYFPHYTETVRPRLSVLYGVYGGLKPRGSSRTGNPIDEGGEDFANTAIGFGIEWMSGDEGFDIEILYVNTNELKARRDEAWDEDFQVNRYGANPLSLAIGYRHRL
jgi:hypothetical protein